MHESIVHFAIYWKTKEVKSHKSVMDNELNKQNKVLCNRYKRYLIKVPKELEVKCTCKKFKSNRCNNQSTQRYSHGLNNLDKFECNTSICAYFSRRYPIEK